MKHLFALNPYIWRYKGHLILGILFVIASNFFAVYPAQIVRVAINMVGDILNLIKVFQGFTAGEQVKTLLFSSLLLFGGLVVLMAIIRGVFLFLTRQTLIVLSRRVEYDFRNDLYNHIQSLSLTFYRRNRTGDTMARLTEDVGRIRMYLGPGIMYTINTISLTIIVVVTMIAVNPEMTLYALLPLPFLSFLIYYVESIIQRKSDVIQRQLSKLTTITQEIFSGIRVIKAYVKEDESGNKFEEECDDYKEKSMGLARVSAIFMPVIIALVGMSVILAIWVGSEKVVAGTLTLGNIAEFIIYINLLTWPIIAIGWVTTLIQRAAASQARLNELFAERSEIRFPDSKDEVHSASLSFHEVSYTYEDTGISAIQDVSFTLEKGKKLGILGPTGSGKSTLCALIPRLLDYQYGSITLDGRLLTAYNRDALRSSIGYAPQDVFLFSDSIRNNIAFGRPDAALDAIQDAAKSASIHDNIMDFPEEYDTLVGERGVTLSGGQKQRISVARAWIRNPKLLVLDDVLSAVDTQTEETVLNNLRTYRKQNPETSVIMVAHRISCIQDADKIIVVENGKITQTGSHDELVEQEGYYKRIHEKQLLEAASV